MSLFNKVLASVGIGATKVDTKIPRGSYTIGDEINGVIEITGGNVEQPIDEIYLTLMTQYIKKSDDKEYAQTADIARFKVVEKFTILPNEKKEIPFSISLPLNTPVTQGKTRVWIRTGLDIKNAIDPKDQDFIEVLPLPVMSAVMRSIQELGFRTREIECQQAPRHLRGSLEFVQEFEFVPVSGAFRGRLDELEVVFVPSSKSQIELFLQIDRKARGLGSFLSEALEMDESNVRLTISQADLPSLTTKLSDVIKRYA
ncbi:sporulation protein [Bacillus sp. AK128]